MLVILVNHALSQQIIKHYLHIGHLSIVSFLCSTNISITL